MNILLLTGSPHRHGTSALLADEFTRGAQEAGHTVTRFDAAFEDIHACIACERCHNTDKGCVFQDGMGKLNPLLLAADAVVFVSPIYYYDWSAQLKLAIDRFYAINDTLCASSKQTALLLTMADDTMESAAGAIQSFEGMTNYLGWQRRGVIAALSCLDLESMKQTEYPQKAYELGKTF